MAVPTHDGKRPFFALSSFAAAGNSWSQEDDSWRKPTLHVEMVGRQAGFFAQSPVLSTQSLFFLTPETYLRPIASKL
ncbi:MAG: hypothetical protein OET18_07040 [Desulfobacterales bacterium]|nr:hypothetical protein [Desulfobacterales bacterium]